VIWFVVALAALAGLRGMWSPCGLSMLTSLNPMAERSRGHGFAGSAAWYVAGALTGGAALGAGCAVAARLFELLDPSWTVRLALSAVVATVGFVSDSPVLRWSLPDHPRQVNERWLMLYRRWIYAGGFGAQIGCGFATYIMTAAVYTVAGLAVLTASPSSAMFICLVFAGVRGASILAAADLRTSQGLLRRAEWLDRTAGFSLHIVTVAQAAIAVAFALAWTPVAGAVVAAAAVLMTGLSIRTRRASEPTAPGHDPIDAIRVAAGGKAGVRA
jgi:hypothetical protein